MVRTGSRLLDIDDRNVAWAGDLAVALERLGTAQEAAADLPGALKSHRESLALREWLVGQDDANPDWYRNLAISYERVATVLAQTGDMQTALSHQEASLAMMRDLAASYPDDLWYKLDLVRALDLTAVLLEDPTAENREALAILEEMQANGTLPPGYEDWIAGFRRNLGLPTEF